MHKEKTPKCENHKSKLYFSGLSLQWSREFIPNLVLVVGAIFVRRGVWALIDKYFLPAHEDLSLVLSVVVGILLIYLPDGTFTQIGHYKYKEKN